MLQLSGSEDALAQCGLFAAYPHHQIGITHFFSFVLRFLLFYLAECGLFDAYPRISDQPY